MTDRTSAAIFSEIIELFAHEELTLENLYDMTQQYDFSDNQLSDEAYGILLTAGIIIEL